MALQATNSAVADIEEAIVTIVRETNLPRLQERLAAESGVAVERAGYSVLRVLSEHGESPLTPLARQLGLDNSTVSRQVAALERDGLVTRASDPTDRRVASLRLSEAGADALARLKAVRHRMFAEMLGDWSAEDRATLAPLLNRLASAFANYASAR